MYRELSSDDESFPSLFTPDLPGASKSSPSDDEFTPGSTSGATARKGPLKKRKKDAEKGAKAKKARIPKNPTDSPSKTHVNRFKQNLGGGDMVRTVSEIQLAGSGGSAMSRVCVFISKLTLVAFRRVFSGSR
jgi:hypothetical protein